MRLVKGRVVGNTVVVDGETLPDGARVTVYVEDSSDGFTLDEGSIRELLEAQAEIRRGDFVTAEEMLRRLDDR